MGQLIVGEWKAYQYLVESIRKFPKQEDFKVKNIFLYLIIFLYINNGVERFLYENF